MVRHPLEFLERLYRTMARIRACEESLVEPINTSEVLCPCHLYSGEEAIATGVCASLTDQDYILGTHRSHGHFLAKGGAMRDLVAEVFCRETGCSRGRGGSMHLVDPERGFLGAAPIVAGTIPLALGAALASSIRKDRRVAVAFFGDGAAGEGVLYECLNFAALRRLPILFVCENNLYSTHMSIAECRANTELSEIAVPFGARSCRIDGNDVLAVFEEATRAVERCRGGEGPVFLECLTYRQRGHVGPDDNIQGARTDIRPREEVEQWLARDPIKLFRARLISDRLVSSKTLDEIDRMAQVEAESAIQFARGSARPDPREIGNYVFKQSPLV